MNNDIIKEIETVEPGLVVVDIREGAEAAIKLGGQVVIDARPKDDPRFPNGFINKQEFLRYGGVIQKIRSIITNCAYHNEPDDVRSVLVGATLIKEMHDLGFKQTVKARVIGRVPGHWLKGLGKKYNRVLSKETWQEEKETLTAFLEKTST